MTYYVAHNGNQEGPFTSEDVQQMLASGKLDLSDLGWREGAPSWIPLSELGFTFHSNPMPPVLASPDLLHPVDYPTAEQSGWAGHLGKITLVIGIIGLLSVGVLAIPAIIFGHWASSRIKTGQASGASHCKAGLICGYVGVFVLIGFIGEMVEGEGESSPVSAPEKSKKVALSPQKQIAPLETGKVCNRFELRTQVTQSGLDVSLETDLPDETEIKVWIHRNYFQDGKGLIQGNEDEAYAIDYFNMTANVAGWKNPKSIKISDTAWMTELRQKQHELKFGIRSIEQDINVSVFVPVSILKNMEISGLAVRTNEFGFKTIGMELQVNRPIKATPTVPVNALELLKEQTYRVAVKGAGNDKVLLMPAASFGDAVAGRKLFDGPAKHLSSGGTIKILEIRKIKSGTQMYRVQAKEPNGKDMGMAWVNSVALFRHEVFKIE